MTHRGVATGRVEGGGGANIANEMQRNHNPSCELELQRTVVQRERPKQFDVEVEDIAQRESPYSKQGRSLCGGN